MGRHTTPMTTDQAIAILAYDIADLAGRNDGYDGLIPDDADFTQDTLIKLLPDLFRAMGFDPFATKAEAPELPATAEDIFLTHTCNGGKGPYYGRLKPAECGRCQELKNGAPAREAHPAVQAANRKRQLEEESIAGIKDHFCPGGKHSRDTCGPVCTFGEW